MRKVASLALALSASLLLSGCSSSIEGAAGNCETLGESINDGASFKVCVEVKSEKVFVNSGPYLDKALTLGRLIILNSGLKESGGWSDSFKKEVKFNPERDADFMDGLWNFNNALLASEAVVQGDERWDSFIGALATYADAHESANNALSNFMNLNLDRNLRRKNVSTTELSMARERYLETSREVTRIYQSELSGELSTFLSYLRAEIGLTNAQAGRTVFDYLYFSK